MSRWFRLYADAMRNPKVLRLSDGDFRLWVRLLAVASENEGRIPPVDDLKRVLSARLDHLLCALKRLISAGLMDPLEDGYEPHNWSKFQYKSDTSTARVHKFREKRNVSVTPPDTEADTDKSSVAKATSPRASRLAVDWKPGPLPANVAELVALWPDGREKRELEGFRDYWAARKRDAARCDWDKTWHNRIRDQHDRILRENGYGRTDNRKPSGWETAYLANTDRGQPL